MNRTSISKSSLSLVLVIIVLAIVGILFTFAEGDVGSCNAPQGFEAYLSVISDNPLNQSAYGEVKVSGTVEWTCPVDIDPGFLVQYSSIAPSNMANATVRLGKIDGNYTLSIQYMDHEYSTNFATIPGQSTIVTINLQSGDWTFDNSPGG